LKFIAHRGYSRRYAENSLPAFQAVIDHPSNGRSIIGIELDVHPTSDEKVVVMHETVLPLDNGATVPVAKLTFDELQQRFASLHGAGTPPVPDLASVLSLIDHRTELNIEIKIAAYDLDRFTGLITEEIASYGPKNDVVISSFSPDILEHMRPGLAPLGVRFALIFDSMPLFGAIPRAQRSRYDLLHPRYRLLFDAPDKFIAAGQPVRCWTVNEKPVAESLIGIAPQLHIEALMTDDLELPLLFEGMPA